MTYTNNHYQPSTNHEPPRMPGRAYDLVQDPLFYGTVAFFALLTTALPALLGSPLFLRIAQTLGLTIFLAVLLRRGDLKHGLWVALLWLGVQGSVIFLLTWFAPTQVERVIADGFLYRRALLEWFYTGGAFPGNVLGGPGNVVAELAGISLGSLLSGGLVGNWFLVHGVNHYAFGLSSLLGVESPGMGFLAGLAPWRAVQLLGFTLLIQILSQPLLTNRWSPTHYLPRQREELRRALFLLTTGLLSTIPLPNIWHAWFGG
jgi:hypothetical protein